MFSLLQILFSCSSILLFSCSPVFMFSCFSYCRYCSPDLPSEDFILLFTLLQILFSCSPILTANPVLLFCFYVLPTADPVLHTANTVLLFSYSSVLPTADFVLLFSLLQILFSCSSILLFSCSPYSRYCSHVLLFSCSPVLLFTLLQILSKFDRKETLSLYSANKVFILSLVLSKNNKCRDKKRKLFRTCDNFILYYLYLYHST